MACLSRLEMCCAVKVGFSTYCGDGEGGNGLSGGLPGSGRWMGGLRGGGPHRDVLERGVDDLVVVGQAVELEGVQVEEDVVAELHAVDVGVGLQPPAWRRERKTLRGGGGQEGKGKGSGCPKKPQKHREKGQEG